MRRKPVNVELVALQADFEKRISNLVLSLIAVDERIKAIESSITSHSIQLYNLKIATHI